MNYTSPDLRELINQVKLTRGKLHSSSSQDRRNQVARLDEVVTSIERQLPADEKTEAKLRDTLLGACFLVQDQIERDYRYLSPERSHTYSHLQACVNPVKDHQATAREKLICTVHYYQYASLCEDSTQNKILLKDIVKSMQKHTKGLANPIGKIIHAVPTESSINQHMNGLPESYQNAKSAATGASRFFKVFYTPAPNKERMTLVQLAKIVVSFKFDSDDDVSVNSLSRSQRIKMGLLLYIEKSIAKEYPIRSPKNSELYKECRKILNMQDESNLDEIQQLACLASFKSFISDEQSRKMLEAQSVRDFENDNRLANIDVKLNTIISRIGTMESELSSVLLQKWPMTHAFGTAGMIAAAPIGFGLGSVAGLLFGEGRHARPITETAATGVSTMAHIIMGGTSTTSYYAYTLSKLVVDSIASRAFGKIFEFVAIGFGGVIGMGIGFTIDLTYKGFQEVGHRLLDYYDHHPDQMKNTDMELLRALLALPEEVFEPEQQERIRYAAGIEETEPKKSMALGL